MAQNLATRKPAVPGKPKTTKFAESTAVKGKVPSNQSAQSQLGFRKQTQDTPTKTKPQDAIGQDVRIPSQGTRMPARWNLPVADVTTAGYNSYQRLMNAPVKSPRIAIPVATAQHVPLKKSKGSKEVRAKPRSKSPSPEKSNRNKSFFDKYLKFAYDLSTPEGVRQLEAHFFPTDILADQPSTSKGATTTTTTPNNIVSKQMISTNDPRPANEEPNKRDNSIETILERSKFY
ncbi:uncharacterized protein LOC117582579 [Drosophila guanche]|uniref:Uncharacterized protein n=1 Tax=Drosophila guanche TaxID=7266 RepID=A0A3B0JAU0_DROGU|nr:uncharacterized protein LOC117582579 [Drosophila guanche]SPP79447.1 Hypothetical predicted protein [Drosophila guanche]